jgi:DNA-binding beta-propeller fold protein YncE
MSWNIEKIVLFIWLSIWIASVNPITAQNKRNEKLQQKYYGKVENLTSQGDGLPFALPYNRWVDPAGEQIYFGDRELENHALDCALSPDGKWLAVEGRYSVVILSPESKKIISRFVMKSYFGTEGVTNTFSGITWRKNGKAYDLFWSTANSSDKSYVVRASWNGKQIDIIKTFLFQAVAPAKSALPNELLVAEEPGGPVLYVVLNGNNVVEKMEVETGKILWSANVGVAPFGITKTKDKLYVTNWAGSQPGADDPDVAGVPWGSAKVDPLTGATREGSVSVIDPQSGRIIKEILVGLHPNDIISTHECVFVANGNSDEVTVIHPETDEITEKINVRLFPERNPYFGDTPNGLGMSSNGKTLFVANGMDNALAVVKLGKNACFASTEKESRVTGFIPTGAYPGAVAVYRDSLLFVANIEAEGARIPSISESTGQASFNSHRMMASVSVIPVPLRQQLQVYTDKVIRSNQFFRLEQTKKQPRKNAEPVPVPVRIGEPSVINHVVYIIKENRTYDQVLGDMKQGDGDSTLTIFGREITPNTHKICEEFLLMDNFHASGKCSAEGHQWTDMAIVTDYIEKNIRSWFRSYPHVQEDALVYAPTGFIWDNALKHGKSARIYGEACVPEYDKNQTWTSIYAGFKNGKPFDFRNKTTIKPVEKILSQTYPGYDNHQISDVQRAKAFIDELREYEKMEGDQWPELMVMALPNDHTGGIRPGLPTPRAMVANNDLALGQIVEAITKSRFWKNTAIFVVEDDSQSGWDHVSAYRTVGLVISPWSKMTSPVRTNYNQTSVVRTIEQILGIPPMNIGDATAIPMFDCFNNTPDFSPYQAVPNQIPLDEMNKSLSELKGTALHFARKNMEPQFDHIDSGDDDLFNRIIWFAMKGNEPYPKKFAGKEED